MQVLNQSKILYYSWFQVISRTNIYRNIKNEHLIHVISNKLHPIQQVKLVVIVNGKNSVENFCQTISTSYILK